MIDDLSDLAFEYFNSLKFGSQFFPSLSWIASADLRWPTISCSARSTSPATSVLCGCRKRSRMVRLTLSGGKGAPENRSTSSKPSSRGWSSRPRTRATLAVGDGAVHEERQVADDPGQLRDRHVFERPGRLLEQRREIDLGRVDRPVDRRRGGQVPAQEAETADLLASIEDGQGPAGLVRGMVPLFEAGRVEAKRLEGGLDGALDDVEIRRRGGRGEAGAGQEPGREQTEMKVLAVLLVAPPVIDVPQLEDVDALELPG